MIILHEILMWVLIRLRDGMPLTESIYGRVDKFETEDEILINRIAIWKYLKTLIDFHGKIIGTRN